MTISEGAEPIFLDPPVYGCLYDHMTNGNEILHDGRTRWEEDGVDHVPGPGN